MINRPLRVAMWSGPRNISTALLRAWENRADTVVVDEPLYAYYLKATGLQHPGHETILQEHESDWRKVIDALLGPVPGDHPVFYQKHMAHHYLPEIRGEWVEQLQNVFLLREPAAMLISLDKVLGQPQLDDTGLPQQHLLYHQLQTATGSAPLVIDSDDVLNNPEAMLRRLTEALQLEFSPAMLEWPAGSRDTDGVWAEHWYASVNESTGFNPPRNTTPRLPEHLQAVYQQCLPYYDELYAQRMTAIH